MSKAQEVYHSMTWQRLSRYVRRERAGGACEHCGALHGAISADGRSIIRLDCAHLNGNVRDLRLENLRALCPPCHYFYDQMLRVRTFFDRHPELQGVLGPRRPARAKTAGSRKVAKAQRTAEGRKGRRGEPGKRRNGERQRHDLNTEGLAAGPWHGIDSAP